VFDLGFALQQIAPELIVDPKRAIYRIYRDIRFSADKSPYKTHIAAMFVARGIPKNTGAALYFHIAPAEVLVAGGTYMPDSATLRILRQHIATHWEEYGAITKERSFRKMFGDVQGDRLVRPPSGFSADHPAVDVLRMKQHYVMLAEPAELAEGPKLLPRLYALFSAMIPFVRFLNAPLQSQNLATPKLWGQAT